MRIHSLYKRYGRAIGVCALLVFLVGCTTTEQVQKAPLAEGQVISVPADYAQTVRATISALKNLGISIKTRANRSEGEVFLLGRHMNAFSWGEVGRVFIEKGAASPSKVFVIWQKRATYQFAGDNEKDFSRALEEAILKQLTKK